MPIICPEQVTHLFAFVHERFLNRKKTFEKHYFCGSFIFIVKIAKYTS